MCIRDSNDTVRKETMGSWVKIKSFTLPNDFPTQKVRISFDIASWNIQGWVYGRIYKNGIPYGTERSTRLPQTFVEDLIFTGGDEIELFVKSRDAVGYYVENNHFSILGTTAPEPYKISIGKFY